MLRHIGGASSLAQNSLTEGVAFCCVVIFFSEAKPNLRVFAVVSLGPGCKQNFLFSALLTCCVTNV